MSYCVFDLETNGTETFKRFCNPLDPRHSIELACFKYNEYEELESLSQLQYQNSNNGQYVHKQAISYYIVDHLLANDPKIIVGQNIKFDLLWLWQEPVLQEWLKEGGLVWDTQTVEYLLQGQTKEKRNLDVMSVRYGGTVKDDRIGEFYKQGLQSKDIDKDMLLEYCKHDVLNTETIFLKQQQLANREGMLPLIKTYMEHYIAVIEMEYNGMHIDTDLAWKDCKQLEDKLNSISATLVKTVPKNCWDSRIEFNPASSKHVSALLFGTPLPFIDDVPQYKNKEPVIYKTGKRSGQQKTKKEKITINPPSMKCRPSIKPGKSGWYSVDAKTLKLMLTQDLLPEYHEFITLLLEHREISKLLSTYYYREEVMSKNKIKVSGNLSLVLPHTGCLHTEFKTAQTRTGRLASRNPNVQNLSPQCLTMFNSRFKDGKLLEIDFSQLEVYVQAALSLSPKFMEDVKNGIDFHCLRLSYAEDRPYKEVVRLCKKNDDWKAKRKKAKIISFQKAYGAQPERIANDAGLPLETVKKVFEKEDLRYPEIPEYYKSVMEEIKSSTIPKPEMLPIRIKKSDGTLLKYTTVQGEHQHVGFAHTIFNKKYTFYDRGVLTKRGDIFRYYLMTEIQDYPIQGTAADIVALFVGHAYKLLHKHSENVKIINEVHDSLILDVKFDCISDIIETLKDLCAQLPDLIEKRFGFKWPLPFNIDCSVGDNWHQCKEND